MQDVISKVLITNTDALNFTGTVSDTIADGADVTQGAKADAAATDSTSAWTLVALLKGIFAKLAGSLTVAQATASNLKVDLSGTAANATALKVDGSAVTQPVSGNVGGLTTVIKLNPSISTSAYSAGYTVGAIQTLANAVTSNGTAILESLVLLDKSNQKAAMDIFIFDANPTNATTTDHAAFAFSTDDLKVIARVSVASTDYATVNSEAVAVKSGLGIALKAASGTSLYAVAVTSGTPTYSATALQFVWGLLQD